MTVICLGEALIDLVPPAAASPREADSLAIQPGGAPLNIAMGLTRLGSEALFLGCLSGDAFGQRLAELLDGAGVARLPLHRVDRPTRLAVVDHLDRSAPFRFYGDATADTALEIEDVALALHDVAATGLYVGSLLMTNPHGRAVQTHALDSAVRSSIPIFSDPNPRTAAWPSRDDMIEATKYLLSRSAIAKLSLDDARALGWPQTARELLQWCAGRFPAQLFVTDGPAGCWTMRAGDVLHVPALAVDAVDATGAGDAAFAALIARRLSTGAFGEAELRFAAAAGALATQKRGAVAGLPTLEGLEAALDAGPSEAESSPSSGYRAG